MVLKRRLMSILQTLLAPIRERRLSLAQDFIMDLLQAGAARGSKRCNPRASMKLGAIQAVGVLRIRDRIDVSIRAPA
jgi:hypothetical protein